MKRTIFSISITAIIIVLASIMLFDQFVYEDDYMPYSGEFSYTPSDITKVSENFIVVPSSASWKTTDISRIKHTVVATFRGTVMDVGKPVDWYDNVGIAHGAIPITIEIVTNTKNVEGKSYKRGNLFTFYLDSEKMDDKYYISSHEPEFEIGEDVVVHIGKSYLGPMGEGGDNYFVELGDFGKYKITDQKAYNEKHHEGKSIEDALKESRFGI